jgi:hypothetical protein
VKPSADDTDKLDIYDRFGSDHPGIFGDVAIVARADPGNIQQVAASQLAITNSYYQRVLKQARQSFVAAVVAASGGSLFFVAAVSVGVSHKNFNAAILSALAGLIVEVISGLNFWLYGHASSQLDAFHLRLERTQHFLLANSVCESLSTPERDRIRGLLVEQIIAAPTDNTAAKQTEPPT